MLPGIRHHHERWDGNGYPDGLEADDIPLMVAVTIDCNDLDLMADFWARLLGVDVTAKQDGFAFLAHAPDRKVTVWLQQVEERPAGKTRVHLDLAVPDLEATEQRIVELGGGLLERHSWEGFEWRMCTDPEGNVFDVMRVPRTEVE